MRSVSLKRNICPKCEDTQKRRINRRGILERLVLPSFGFYPWECAICRKKTYMRDDGHHPMRTAA